MFSNKILVDIFDVICLQMVTLHHISSSRQTPSAAATMHLVIEYNRTIVSGCMRICGTSWHIHLQTPRACLPLEVSVSVAIQVLQNTVPKHHALVDRKRPFHC